MGIVAFAAFGVLGGFATARNPQSPAAASWFWALVAAAIGAALVSAVGIDGGDRRPTRRIPVPRQDRRPERAIAIANARAFEAAERMAEELETRNIELTKQTELLAEQKAQLEEMNRLKSELMANITHELRTPLNAVIGYAELMEGGAYGEINPEQRENLEAIIDSARGLLNLITQILDMAKMEAGQMGLFLSDVDLGEMLKESAQTAQVLAREKSLKIGLGLPEGGLVLRTDEGKLGQIVNNMQNIAMSMRMIPIKATFMKMIRLVRDLSRKSGKPVSLTMSGEETEIDRNVVDALYEPMVHMIRNSVDHGIEPLDTRREAGKPDQGAIHLSAYHKGGNIIIEIRDDGKGLDRERILAKGIESGLVSQTDPLTDAQIYDLILQPGFSTAKKITDVSGRGVGMDVVKSGIERFRGHLKIESKKGEGTKFTISLPLTLAIIDGMLVRVGKEKYVVPTTAIQRAFKPEEDNCFTVEGKGEMIQERERLIPVVRLKNLYSDEKDDQKVWDGLVVVVESKDDQKALLIDELLGKDEYVIKSLGGNLEGVPGFSGGAILADGRVGLILDIHGIFQLAETD